MPRAGTACAVKVNCFLICYWRYPVTPFIVYLHQSGAHGHLASHAMANQNAFSNVQLAKELPKIIGHCFIGQNRAMRTVSMVTSIYSQHLTGQRRIRTLAEAWERKPHYIAVKIKDRRKTLQKVIIF